MGTTVPGPVPASQELATAQVPALEVPANDLALVRTDYTDPAGWESLWQDLQVNDEEREEGFAPPVLVENPFFDGMSPEAVARQYLSQLFAPAGEMAMIEGFLADSESLRRPDHAVLLLCVLDPNSDIYREYYEGVPPLRMIRVAARAVSGPNVNLALANMDYEDFADAVDADGVFRGFGA